MQVSGFLRRIIKTKKNNRNAWLHHINNRARHNLGVVLCIWRYKSPTLSHHAHTSALLSWLYIIHIYVHTFVSALAPGTLHAAQPPSDSVVLYIYRYIINVRSTHTTYILLLYSCKFLLSLSTRNSILPFTLYTYPLTPLRPAIVLYKTLLRPPPLTISATHPPPKYILYIYCTRWISASFQKSTLLPGNSPRARQIM